VVSVLSFRGRTSLVAVVGLHVLSLSLALPLCALPPSHAPSDDEVRGAAEQLYVHGMTQEIADTEIGPAGVPQLLRLLWDPDFERRDNVVAFLAYLGDADTVTELHRFLERRPFSPSVPEEDRALLLVPEALGRIAGRTADATALETLLALTSGETARDRGLVEMAIRGLMFSGAAEARVRLDDLSRRRIAPVIGSDLAEIATDCLAWLDRGQSDPSESSALRTLEPHTGDQEAPAVPADFDLSPITHNLSLDYANHVDLGAQYRMNDARLDRMMDAATELVGLEDFAEDVACCATLTRSAPGRIFGSAGDGLDILTTQEEMDAVLPDPIARVKVVRQIGFCGGQPQTNVIGCAYVSGYGLAVVRYGDVTREAVLWTHEFGHNLGLGHTDDERYIMNRSIDAVGGLDYQECRSFHFPPQAAAISPVAVGICADDDDDGRHEVIDNCPNVENPNQNDFDGDGAGDVCDNCTHQYNPDQHDDDQDSLGDTCDNCRWVANLDQSDLDRDEVGDVCDNCPAQINTGQQDGDEDFVGDVCDNCPLQFNPEQTDFDGDAIGDVCEQGASLADADGSGKVDGFDLVCLARAFGSRSTEPNYEVTVDLDRNDRVDGEDLAILAGHFGDLVE